MLAGYVRTSDGERLFSVAAPGIGKRLASARRAEERWLLDLLERHGGAAPGECGEPVLHSDAEAEVRSIR